MEEVVAVFGRILHRMILWELLKVFLMSLVGITGILLLAGIVAEASQQGLGPAQILAAIPLLVPSTLPYTIPATTLFASCMVYGRLAADNEILAIKSAGINIIQVVKPGMLLGIATSCITMGLYFSVIPYTHALLRSLVFYDTEELLYSLLRRQGVINHPQTPFSMWVRSVQGRKLLNPTFKRRNAEGQIDVVAQSREAELHVDMAKKLLLVHMKWGVATMDDGSRAYFEDRIWEVPLPKEFTPGGGDQRRARDMMWNELQKSKRDFQQKAKDVEVEIALQTSRLLMEGGAQDLPKHIQNLNDRRRHISMQILTLDVELLMRPALSMGCLFFILVGCPVGIWFSRSDYLSSFITCFMPIILIYYPLLLCGTGMARDGRLNPIPLVWAADIVIGAVGLVLFWRLVRN
jgi:lipopolysaccharide export system permease protein